VGVREARVLVLSGRIRPGRAAGRPRARPIELTVRSVTYRRAGKRTLSFRLTQSASRVLGRSRNARLSLRVYADARRGQPIQAFTKIIRR
jgi:hypothetical protein